MTSYCTLPVSATATCDPLPPPSPSPRDYVIKHLNQLLDEMWVILNWQIRYNFPFNKHIKYPEYLAMKLTKSQIIDYMSVFKDCRCCKRHTRNNMAPSLFKVPKVDGEYCHPNACHCNCRHKLRRLNDALTILLL